MEANAALYSTSHCMIEIYDREVFQWLRQIFTTYRQQSRNKKPWKTIKVKSWLPPQISHYSSRLILSFNSKFNNMCTRSLSFIHFKLLHLSILIPVILITWASSWPFDSVMQSKVHVAILQNSKLKILKFV